MVRSLNQPKTHAIRLKNGVSALSIEVRHLARAHIGVTLRGGPVYEPDTCWGLSHVLEHMVFRGTKAFPSTRAVSIEADACGGTIDGATYRDRVLYDMRVDPECMERGLNLLAQMMHQPRLQGLDIEKQVILEELLESRDEQGQDIDPDNWSYKALFPSGPLSRTIEGLAAQVRAFTVRDLRRFLKSHYSPQNMTVVTVGPYSHRTMENMVRRTFGGLPAGKPIPSPQPNCVDMPSSPIHVVRSKLSQTHVRLCFASHGMDIQERYRLLKLSKILDDGPASRFQSRLIDGQGLAYALWATTDFYEGQGVFEIGAQVEHRRVLELVTAVIGELHRLAERAPQKNEQVRIEKRFERMLRDLCDQPGQLTEVASRYALFGHSFDLNAANARFAEVTGAHVRKTAQELLSKCSPVLVLVGQPPKTQVNQLRRHLNQIWR